MTTKPLLLKVVPAKNATEAQEPLVIVGTGGGGKRHLARLEQLQSIVADNGDDAECAKADLFREYGPASDSTHT